MPWFIWCDNNSTATTSNCYQYPTVTAGDPIWLAWSGTITNTLCNTNALHNMIWVQWVGDSTPSGQLMQFAAPPPPVQQPQPTAAELEQARQAAEAYRQKAEAVERERAAAHKKAMELLRANLTKKQRDDLDKRQWFLVEGGKSKKTYRISGKSCAGNITELAGDREVARYCVHAGWQIPLGDQLLAQALYLRLDEEYIIGRANKTALAA